MISRRLLLQSAGAAGAAALLPSLARAQSAATMLTPGVPNGIASYAVMGELPGKQPLILTTTSQAKHVEMSEKGGVAAIVVALVPLGIALLLIWARFG